MRFVALMLCCLLTGCTSTRLGQDGWDEFEVPHPLEAPGPEGVRVFNGQDVVGQLVRLQKPGDVAGWWEMEAKAHPEQWLHPLSLHHPATTAGKFFLQKSSSCHDRTAPR